MKIHEATNESKYFFFYSRIIFLKFHLFKNLKLNIIQQFLNFKSDLRIKHQEKLKNLFEITNLQNFIDQIINFEKSETLTKAHKKNKLNARDANFNERKNDIEKNDLKRFRGERKNNRNRNRNREYCERNNSRENRKKGNNFNYKFVTKKKA